MAALCDNLWTAWSGDYDSLKKFISIDLKLDGNWGQPGSDKKFSRPTTFQSRGERAKACSTLKVTRQRILLRYFVL